MTQEQFWERLAHHAQQEDATNKWLDTPNDGLRTLMDGICHCPITYLCKMETGGAQTYAPNDWRAAADELQLKEAFATHVVNASDRVILHREKVRERLLSITGAKPIEAMREEVGYVPANIS